MANYSNPTVDAWRTELLVLPSAFDGAIDEIALYEIALPDAVIAAHWQSVQAHQPYQFADTAVAPAAATTARSGAAVPLPAGVTLHIVEWDEYSTTN